MLFLGHVMQLRVKEGVTIWNCANMAKFQIQLITTSKYFLELIIIMHAANIFLLGI